MVMEVIAAQILIAVTFPWFAWLSDKMQSGKRCSRGAETASHGHTLTLHCGDCRDTLLI